MNTNPLDLILTFDAEADVFDNSIDAAEQGEWRGIEVGIPLIEQILDDLSYRYSSNLRVTWFVRTDGEIAAQYGDAAYLLRHFDVLWRKRIEAGDEIAFHPHLSHLAKTDQTGKVLRAEIVDAYAAVRAAGYNPVTSRIGEAFGSNVAYAVLQELGFKADSTAMSGRVRNDADRLLDWSGTPVNPYHPKVEDYRIPGEPSHALWQIPMTMVPVLADYDSKPLPRYVDLSFRPSALEQGLKAALATIPMLVTVTHPSSFLPEISFRKHGLLSFDIKSLHENLESIFEECNRLGREVRPTTLADYTKNILCK